MLKKFFCIRNIISLVAFLIFIGCLGYVINYYVDSYKAKQEFKRLQNMVDETPEDDSQLSVITTTTEPINPDDPIVVPTTVEPIIPEKKLLKKYKTIYEQNNDLVGWLKIGDTTINYPVVQTKDDPEYYLRRNFKGEKSTAGVLFADYRCDIFEPTANIIIYGHNMSDGSMFHSLLNYKKQSFYKENKIIRFDTIYELAEYEVVSAFRTRVYSVDDEVFKYYKIFDLTSEKEFDYFVDNITKLSIYKTGVVPTYGDTFITLSTCDYSMNDGRFVVIARKIIN